MPRVRGVDERALDATSPASSPGVCCRDLNVWGGLGEIQIIDTMRGGCRQHRRRRYGIGRKEAKLARASDFSLCFEGKTVVSDEIASKRKERVYSYGYKQHVSINAHSGLITTLRHGPDRPMMVTSCLAWYGMT